MLDSSGECLGEMRRGENYQPTNTLICARDEAKRINGTYGVLYLARRGNVGGKGEVEVENERSQKKKFNMLSRGHVASRRVDLSIQVDARAFEAFPSQLTPPSLPFPPFYLGHLTFRLQPPGPFSLHWQDLTDDIRNGSHGRFASLFFSRPSPISQLHSSLTSISTPSSPRMSMRHARRSVRILRRTCHPC